MKKQNRLKVIEIESYENGTKRFKYRKRCEVCKFVTCDLLSDDWDLICKKTKTRVDDYHLCENFKLKEAIKQDMIDGCMPKMGKRRAES